MEKLDEEARVLGGDAAHAEAALLLRAADLIPGNEKLSTGDFVGCSPQKSATQAVESREHTGRKLESTHGEGGEGVEDGVEQHQPAAGGEKESAPAGQVFVNFCDQRGERREPEFLSRQRQPEVGLRESFDVAAQLVLDLRSTSGWTCIGTNVLLL
jgi:hypothetical protein